MIHYSESEKRYTLHPHINYTCASITHEFHLVSVLEVVYEISCIQQSRNQSLLEHELITLTANINYSTEITMAQP